MPSKRLAKIRLSGVFAGVGLLASAAMAEGDSGGIYIGDLGQAVASLLAFAILLLILKKYAWKPILEQLDKREKDIVDRLGDARKKQTQAQELQDQYNSLLADSKEQAQQIHNDVRREAEAEKQQVIVAAQKQAHQILQRAQADIEQAKEEAHKELQNETARLVAEIAQNVLGRNLSPEEHKRLIEQASEHITTKMGGES